MRRPSSRVLINRVDIYPHSSGVDAGGGVKYTYDTTPKLGQVPCSVQFKTVEEMVLDWEQSRVSQVNTYEIMFGAQQPVNPRDKLLWKDTTGTVRTLFVTAGKSDEAGRGAAFVVKAIEEL